MMYEALIDRVLDGRYKIIQTVGIGGMSVVYAAYDLVGHRTVAVKVLREKTEGELDGTDSHENAQARFENEARIMTQLSHRNIVNIVDGHAAEGPGLRYFVMEYIQANTLESRIKNLGTLTAEETLHCAEQVLLALLHVHSNGVIHCDVKPQNVMLQDDGGIKLTDFGIARFVESAENKESDIAVGTVYYISPEQASGKPLDARSDLYSLGVMMYEMATGILPFNAENPANVTRMHIEKAPRRPSSVNPNIPKGLEQIILHAMEKQSFMRFSDATEMLKVVRELQENPDLIFDFGNSVPEPVKEEKGEKSNTSVGIRSGMLAAFGAATAFIIVFIITLTAAVGVSANAGAVELTMPELEGTVWYGEAAAGMGGGLYRVRVKYIVDASLEENTVISQSVNPGKTKKATEKSPFEVTIKVSRKSELLKMRDCVLLDADKAKAALEDIGFRVKIERTASQDVPEGRVISTYPSAGADTEIGASVTLTVSSGK